MTTGKTGESATAQTIGRTQTAALHITAGWA
jgi:hypothetical protein